ncbi:IS630 family transposase [Aulosira sp. FACHB-615]|uniref:IS630 family transposase n=1 Tax=Aulosira sp. FACHB-615 TaxID=2692777 RepID=UPI001683AE56|nr:IS630 family transposase [Aulosira sp. FACHB-615]MBD2491965.1 IS630 family transposase [Aulosira sp. FACHB-615]
MPASYSYDLRTKVINAIDSGMRKTQASRIFQISRNTIDTWLKKRKDTGDYQAKVRYQQGYKPKITDLEQFQQFVQENGSKTQAEMAEAWPEKISDRTIGKALRKLVIPEKKTYGYRERDEEKRREFQAKISQKERSQLVYVDESGIDNREDYGYGWNPRGERFYDVKSGRRNLRVSIMSALCQGKLVAPLTFEGSCNRLVFEKWLEEKLLPELKLGQTVILDNATFHKSQKIRELIESVGCELEYLPPYSPDLNDIEHYWFPIKNRVRKSVGTIDNFRDRVDTAIRLTS